MIGSLNTVSVAISGALDNEVADWYARVQAHGGSADSATLGALNEFMHTLKLNNIRNKIRRCNLFCGYSLRSSLHPIINSAKEGGGRLGYERDIPVGFADSDYSQKNGLWAMGVSLQSAATKYLSTGAFISEIGIGSQGGHVSFMSATSLNPIVVSSVGGYIMPLSGGDKQANTDLSAFIEFSSGSGTVTGASASAFAPGVVGHAEAAITDNQDISGLWVATRTSSTNQELWQATNEKILEIGDAGTEDQSLWPIGGYKFRIFGSPSGGGTVQTSSYKLLFYSLGKSLTKEEIGILNDALIDFNNALGRT